MNRDINIDLMKVIAAFGVVGLHSVGLRNYTLYYLCTFAVPVFYMINGYLMFKKESISYGYALKKVLCYLRIIFCFNLILILPLMVFRKKIINPFSECLRSILQKGYLWHFWFFGAMIVLELLLPVIHKLLKGHIVRHVVFILIGVACCESITLYSMSIQFPMQLFTPQCFRIWTILTYFLIGGFFAEKRDSLQAFFDRKNVRGLMTLVVIALTVITNYGQKHLGHHVYQNRMAEHFYDEMSVMVWVVCIFLLVITLHLEGISEGEKKRIVGMSSLTLGVFIIHPLLLWVVDSYWDRIPSLNINSAFLIGVWIATALISGAITYVMIKIPVVKKLVTL